MPKSKTLKVALLTAWMPVLWFIAYVYAESWTGKVVGISDGDTITVMHENRGIKIRLAEIDCPESGQPFGKAAKRLTSDLCFGKGVTVQVETTDRYGRTVGHVKLPDGYDLSEELLSAGLAWHYKKYSDRLDLGKMELDARAAALGIWSLKDPVAPWDWRHGTDQPKKMGAESTKLNGSFHGNANSKVFHKHGCKYFIKPAYKCTNYAA